MTCEASGAGEQVRDCMLQAEQCAFRAKIEPDPVVAREYLNMERRCLSLARCLEFQERLQSFSSHNKKRLDHRQPPTDTVMTTPR